MNLPFSIGDKLWQVVRQPQEKTFPCPVCAGHRSISVGLGSGEVVIVPCEGCGLGYDGPRGSVREWVYEPGVEEFIISGVDSMHNDRWMVLSERGGRAYHDELWLNEEDALAAAQKSCADAYEHMMESWQFKKKSVKHTGWTVRYHRDQIKDLERKLAWHQEKVLSMGMSK